MSLFPLEWRPDGRTLRRFAVSLLVLCTAAAGYLYFARGLPRVALGVEALGVVGAVVGLVRPQATLPLYWLFMLVSYPTGLVVGPVLLALVYYLVFTPLALAMRLVGRDRLRLRRAPASSYWCDTVGSERTLERYERQF